MQAVRAVCWLLCENEREEGKYKSNMCFYMHGEMLGGMTHYESGAVVPCDGERGQVWTRVQSETLCPSSVLIFNNFF